MVDHPLKSTKVIEIKQETKNDRNKQKVEIKRAPFAPTNLPNRPLTIDPKKGKNKTFKYILKMRGYKRNRTFLT